MADDVDPMNDIGESSPDFFEHHPSKLEKLEMRKAVKPPSEWLKLLCREWAMENELLVETTDAKFLDFKPYLKGLLSSQLLCRLSIPLSGKDGGLDTSHNLDFWQVLGIDDCFDRAYIVAQIEKFCTIYNIRGGPLDDVESPTFPTDVASSPDPAALAAAAAAGISFSPGGNLVHVPAFVDQGAAAAAAAAATAAAAAATVEVSKLSKKHISDVKYEVDKAHRLVKIHEKALENERRENKKLEQRRLTQERKEQKQREREANAVRKAAERASREASREERRRKKIEIRAQREKFAQEQKDAALKRAAELVSSNRVPIEITRGAVAAKAAASAALEAGGAVLETDDAKKRSAITVSTAADLNQIVTHSKNLWAKYNAIAKEHNQKVSWLTVSRELGIHVKVREKYARMHARAEQRGFDWEKNGHIKIKDHPEIFLEPTQAEQKAKMPPPRRDSDTIVLVEGNKVVSDEAVSAAAAVVDAAVTSPTTVDGFVETTDEQAAAAAAVAASLVADPTSGLVSQPI